MQLVGDLNALRTVRHTLSTAYAVAGLTELGDGAVVAHKEGTSGSPVLVVLCLVRHVALVDAFVVMSEDGGDVYSVGTRHAILAVVTRDGV